LVLVVAVVPLMAIRAQDHCRVILAAQRRRQPLRAVVVVGVVDFRPLVMAAQAERLRQLAEHQPQLRAVPGKV
jgi:hypothetical protein